MRCRICKAFCFYLGCLGDFNWYRCRACGTDQSRRIKRKVKDEPKE